MSKFNCDRCNDTGFYSFRVHFPFTYVGPGSPPEDARGVAEVRCYQCRAADKIASDRAAIAKAKGVA